MDTRILWGKGCCGYKDAVEERNAMVQGCYCEKDAVGSRMIHFLIQFCN